MSKDFTGIIIEESLENPEVLKKVKIIKTRVEKVTEKHKTPWVKQWTMYTVKIPEEKADSIAEELGKSLDSKHSWYADFKNDKFHYVIFCNRIFRIDKSKKEQYDEAVRYGISLKIPEYELDFSPHIKEWKR